MVKTIFNEAIKQTIVSLIKSAKNKICCAVQAIKDTEIGEALLDARKREVETFIFLNKHENNFDLIPFINAGVDVYSCDDKKEFAYKYLLIDESSVLYTSCNWVSTFFTDLHANAFLHEDDAELAAKLWAQLLPFKEKIDKETEAFIEKWHEESTARLNTLQTRLSYVEQYIKKYKMYPANALWVVARSQITFNSPQPPSLAPLPFYERTKAQEIDNYEEWWNGLSCYFKYYINVFILGRGLVLNMPSNWAQIFELRLFEKPVIEYPLKTKTNYYYFYQSDLMTLRYFYKLRFVYLNNSGLSDLNGIQYLRNLEVLHCYGNPLLDSLHFLIGMPKLRYVVLDFKFVYPLTLERDRMLAAGFIINAEEKKNLKDEDDNPINNIVVFTRTVTPS